MIPEKLLLQFGANEVEVQGNEWDFEYTHTASTEHPEEYASFVRKTTAWKVLREEVRPIKLNPRDTLTIKAKVYAKVTNK